MDQIKIKMDLIVAHKIIRQIEKKEKEEKKEIEKKRELKVNSTKTYSKICGICGQNLIWCICK